MTSAQELVKKLQDDVRVLQSEVANKTKSLSEARGTSNSLQQKINEMKQTISQNTATIDVIHLPTTLEPTIIKSAISFSFYL